MAIKLSSEDLAALNIGESQVSRGYIGTTEIYPNDIAITSASYDAASIANTGGTTGYTVTGTAGAEFYFVTEPNYGYPTGTVGNMPGSSNVQTMGSSGTATFSPWIGSRAGCFTAAAIPGTNTYNQIQIVPVAPTILGAGVSQYDYLAQAGGSNFGSWQINTTSTVTILNNSKTTVGGTTYWVGGGVNPARFNIKFNYSGLAPDPWTGGSTYSNFYWGDGTTLWMRGLEVGVTTNPSALGSGLSNHSNNMGMTTIGSNANTWFYSTSASTVQAMPASGELSFDWQCGSNFTEATFILWWQGGVGNGGGAYSSCWSFGSINGGSGGSPGYSQYQVNVSSASTGVA